MANDNSNVSTSGAGDGETAPASNYAVIQDGSVVNVIVWDGNTDTWSPPEGSAAVRVPDGLGVSVGWTYDESTFIAPPAPPVVPPTPAEILSVNTSIRNSLLVNATAAIAPLQDAVDIGEATADDTAMLLKWKTYRVAVNRVDLTQASPTWPAPPSDSTYASSTSTSAI